MTCPPQIARILLQIFQDGILRARASAGDAEKVRRETDHIHNLPALLLDFRPELLRFYLDVERKAYRQMSARASDELARLWVELEQAAGDGVAVPA